MNRKVLIVTYYWFPAEGTGVYRISRFVKYLKQKGWEPVILTAEKSHGFFKDTPQDVDFGDIPIYKSKIWEPADLFKKFSGKKKGKGTDISPTIFLDRSTNWRVKISAWIRLNFFIPDAKKYWRKPAVKLGKRIIEEVKPDLIFSTSPPPTTNLIARDLAKWSKLPWVADFRDPWTKIYYLEKAPVTMVAKKLNERLERKSLKMADQVTVVNNGFFPHLDINKKQTKIPNGFDPSDYPNEHLPSPAKFIIRYFGQWKENQQPPALFAALKRLANTQEYRQNMKLECYGTTATEVRSQLQHYSHLPVEFKPFIPKTEAVKLMTNAGLLLLIIGVSSVSKHILSTKIFDYLYARKPILGIGPTDGSAAEVLDESNCGKMFDYAATEEIYDYIEKTYSAWKEGRIAIAHNENAINQYDFDHLTDRLIEVFKTVLQNEQESA